jgi:CysZ protein
VSALAKSQSRKLGFLDGVAAPFDGLRFVVSSPSTWVWAIVPLVFVVAIAALLGWAGLALVAHFARGWTWVARVAPFWRSIAWLVVEIVTLVIALFVGWFLALPLSGFALERIVRQRERALGIAPHAEVPTWRASLRSFGASLASMLVTVVVLVVLTIVDFVAPAATIVTVPLRTVVAAITLAWDVLDYPLALRPMTLRSRINWFFRHFAASLGFGLALTVLFFVPGANLILLPASVAGAAKLVAKTER